MKGITCSEAKDILEKLNRLERLRQGTKTEMAEVCKEPEKGVNPFGDEFKDFGEQIIPEKNGIFWSLYRFFLCKHLFLTGLFAISFLMAFDTEPEYWVFIPIAWVIAIVFFGLWFWAGAKLNPMTPKQADVFNTLAIREALIENNGRVPKGYTKEECIDALAKCGVARYKRLKKAGRV